MPSQSEVHVDAALSNFAVTLGQQAFVADVVAPPLPVVKESDKYYIFGAEHWNDDVLQPRAPGKPAREIEWTASTATYEAEEYALKHLLPDRIRNNADTPIRPRERTVSILMQKLLLARERRVKALLDDITTISYTTVTGSLTAWDASSGVTIEANIDTAKEAFVKQCGMEPSHILIPPAVAKVVKRDSTIRGLVQYTDKTLLVNGDLPPQMFNLRVVIPGAIYNSAAPGLTASVARIWSTDDVILLYVADNPGVDVPSAAYQMRVQQAGMPVVVRSWREEDRGGEMIEANMIQDEKLVSAACAHILYNVLT